MTSCLGPKRFAVNLCPNCAHPSHEGTCGVFIPEACFDDALNDDYCDCWLCRTEGSQCDGYDCICTYPYAAPTAEDLRSTKAIDRRLADRIAPRSGE